MPTQSQPTASPKHTPSKAVLEYLPLAVMACPQHAGKHPFHDQRWIVTAGTTTEHGYDPRPDQWHTVGGSLVAEVRDVAPGLAAHIVHCVNSHPALVAENKRLRECLYETERTLAALATSELNIDHDRNRTPLRLAQRNDVWRAIESARAALAAKEDV